MVSVVILNWEKPETLGKIVKYLNTVDAVDEIIISHGKSSLNYFPGGFTIFHLLHPIWYPLSPSFPYYISF